MLRRFLAGALFLLPLAPAATAQVPGGGVGVNAVQTGTSFETGLNRCTGQIETRRCCSFRVTVRNTTLNPISTFWLEIEAGQGAVLCYDHGAPFGTDDISFPGCLATMCYGWDCGAYLAANGSNRGVIRVDCLIPILPGASITGKFVIDTSRTNAGPLGAGLPAAHGVQRGCVHVHATSNSPASLGATCGTGNFSAHINNLVAQFWTPSDDWCCCETQAVTYCTSGTSSAGCQALIGASGTSSASADSGFFLHARNVEGTAPGVSGLFYYGINGRQGNSWGNPLNQCTSFQCVMPPTRRGALLNGGGTPDACDGQFDYDLNARWTEKPHHNPGVGATVQAQLWYRDPDNPCTGAMAQSTTALSNAIEWVVCP